MSQKFIFLPFKVVNLLLFHYTVFIGIVKGYSLTFLGFFIGTRFAPED